MDKGQMIDDAISTMNRFNQNKKSNEEFNIRRSGLSGKKVKETRKSPKAALFGAIAFALIAGAIAGGIMYTEAETRLYTEHGYNTSQVYNAGLAHEKKSPNVEDYKPTVGEVLEEMFRGK